MSNNAEPENTRSNESQCALLANYLLKGNKWHCKLDIRRDFGIGYPNSRLSDLRHEYSLQGLLKVAPEKYESKNRNGNTSRCNIYYIETEKLHEAREVIRKNHIRFFEKILALVD